MTVDHRVSDEWERALRISRLLGDLARTTLAGWDETDPAVLLVAAEFMAFSAATLDRTPTPVGEETFTRELAASDREFAALAQERAEALADAPLPFLRAFQPDRVAALDERWRLWNSGLATLIA